jgi:hypothetical protein
VENEGAEGDICRCVRHRHMPLSAGNDPTAVMPAASRRPCR